MHIWRHTCAVHPYENFLISWWDISPRLRTERLSHGSKSRYLCNRLDFQGHLCCLSSPALHWQLWKLDHPSARLSPAWPFFYLYLCLFPFFLLLPPLHMWNKRIPFLTLLSPPPRVIRAMNGVKGFVLSSIRSRGGTPYGKLEPASTSWKDVSVTALSTDCRTDDERSASSRRGRVKAVDGQSWVRVTGLAEAQAQGEKRDCSRKTVCLHSIKAPVPLTLMYALLLLFPSAGVWAHVQGAEFLETWLSGRVRITG